VLVYVDGVTGSDRNTWSRYCGASTLRLGLFLTLNCVVMLFEEVTRMQSVVGCRICNYGP